MVDPSAAPTPHEAFLRNLPQPEVYSELVKVRVLTTQSSFRGEDGSHFALQAGANMVVPRHIANAMVAQQLAEEV